VIDRGFERASVVILAKHSAAAKSRLRLPPGEARQVALLLASATVRTALAANTVGAVLVVTGDPAIALDALEAGADVVLEPLPLGMNRAAALGRRRALDIRPEAPVAILVADLPHLRPRDIDVAVAEFDERKVPTYVADNQRTGTTFLIHGPDQHPGIGFGEQSASMHRRLGYREAITAPYGLRADLDTPEDLEQLGARRRRRTTSRLEWNRPTNCSTRQVSVSER
jgi:2-phospho-L-lactate guanylyltransferase